MNNNATTLSKSKENINKSFNSQIGYKLYSIEDIEKNPNRYIKISTPRSLLALKQTGISQDELYFVSFLEFIQKASNMCASLLGRPTYNAYFSFSYAYHVCLFDY